MLRCKNRRFKKKLLKEVKNNNTLCLELFSTGNSDAQYLAGLGLNPKKMTLIEIEELLEKSSWIAIDEAIISGIAAESSFATNLASKWLESTDERKQNVGWLTYGKYLSITPDDLVSKKDTQLLLEKISVEIYTAPNTIRYSMNQFIIYVGQYYPCLTDLCLDIAQQIEDVEISLATKGCKLPNPTLKIKKSISNGKLGVKRKKVIC